MKIKKLLFGIFLFLLFAASCKKNNDNNYSDFDEISDIATFHGAATSSIVVVNTQGGPVTTLEDEMLQEFISETDTENTLYVNVHQVQTKTPEEFRSSDITFDQAKKFDLQSIASLKRVVDFFKGQKEKQVYVLGISFGAFMIQELIASHGTDVADGFLIMVGRLDIDEDTWKPFSQGQYTKYIYDADGSYTIKFLRDGKSAEDRNNARLAAGLGFNRYTERLNDISDLSKITYVYGDRDEEVGPLSTKEIDFLRGKGANVILSKGSDHDDAISAGLDILKKTFNIP